VVNFIFCEMYLRNLFGRDKEPEIELFTKLLSKNSFVIDVGANRGTYSFPIIRRIRKRGFLFLFEPIPELYEYLNTGFASYKNVKIFPLACSDKNETREISIPTSEGNLGFGSASFVNKHIDFQSKSIECVRIDDLEIAKLNFIKIDVEGFEFLVLKGALKTIENNRPVILAEIDFNMGNTYFMQLTRMIQKLDYRVFALTGGQFLPVNLTEFDSHELNFHSNGYRNNFFLIPAEQIAKILDQLTSKKGFYFLKRVFMLN